ncbi:MAG: hypothetical protein ACI88H_001421 [Cocleimonas sp.]|jgi:hypothetical protein
MRPLTLYSGEHLYSGLVRARYLAAQMHINERRFFELNDIPYHRIRSQTPLCRNTKAVLDVLNLDQHERFALRLRSLPFSPWLLSYSKDQNLTDIEVSGLRNNLEETPFAIDRRWKYCPKCAEENKREYGVSYWHCLHQSLGASVCHIHSIELHSHDKLRYLDFYLPHQWLGKSEPLKVQHDWQKSWQPFIYGITQSLQADTDLAQVLKQQIYKHLGFERPLKRSDKAVIDEQFLQMRADLGEDCLSGLFTSFSTKHCRPPNILWITLSSFSQTTGIRHPLYWLSILFWLRDELPALKR